MCRLLSIKLFISRPVMQGCGWGSVAGLMALGEARIGLPYSSGVLAADGFGRVEPQNGPLTDSGALRSVQKNTVSRVQRSSSLNLGCAFPRAVAYMFPVHTRVLFYGSFSRSYTSTMKGARARVSSKDYGILHDLVWGDCSNDDCLRSKKPLASCKFFANLLIACQLEIPVGGTPPVQLIRHAPMHVRLCLMGYALQFLRTSED